MSFVVDKRNRVSCVRFKDFRFSSNLKIGISVLEIRHAGENSLQKKGQEL